VERATLAAKPIETDEATSLPIKEKRMLCCSEMLLEENAMKTHRFTVIVYKEEDIYVAECPEVGTAD
jgi:hypothetical protein